MTPLLIASLLGCWKPVDEEAPLDFTEVPYDNPYVASPDAVISAFDTPGLKCPDNENARFFAAYSKSAVAPAPVVILLHSGPFDYVIEPDPGAALAGEHYQGTSRLTRGWATGRVWETLGLQEPDVTDGELNLGTLPAAAVDAGAVVLVPSNCWGDLWHGESGIQDNEYEIEGFDRNGRTMAWWMIRALVEGNFADAQGFSIPIDVDLAKVHIFGLGEGGRGVAELIRHNGMPTVASIMVDSSPDLLQPYLDDPELWAEEAEGLARIYREEDLGSIDDYSIAALARDKLLPARTAYIWSDGDPRLPLATVAPSAEKLDGQAGVWVHNTATRGHVFSNQDPTLAADVVEYALFGTTP